MTAPELRKIFDIYDVAISLAPNSETGDVTAELVDVGVGGRAEDYAGEDVKGKIVLGSAGPTVLQRLGVFERGAAGVMSYTALKPEETLDQILSSNISANAPLGRTPGFGWVVAPRVGRELARRVGRGGKVTLRSVVKSEFFPGELEVVHAMIPGDGSSQQAVMISAHLYEGYIKQGANDDNSGCAVTLEMGRTLVRLVNEGKLPKPKRDIHFLWVPEISGTNGVAARARGCEEAADCGFQLRHGGAFADAGGERVGDAPDAGHFPNVFEPRGAERAGVFCGDEPGASAVSRERVQVYVAGGGANGTRDPFWVIVDKHYGSSDHVVYLNNGIASVTFTTWPDPWYHASQDTPDKLDSTQFKRVAVVGTAQMSALASADERMAARILAESLARGSERMGAAQKKGLSYLADAGDGRRWRRRLRMRGMRCGIRRWWSREW